MERTEDKSSTYITYLNELFAHAEQLHAYCKLDNHNIDTDGVFLSNVFF